MNQISLVRSLLVVGFLSSCSTADITMEGSRVEMVHEKPGGSCENLGPVFGKGGGSFGGGWISDESLMEYASNDVRNNAAKKGATHVVVNSHQMGNSSGQYGGTTSTATYSGIAYKCK